MYNCLVAMVPEPLTALVVLLKKFKLDNALTVLQ